MLTMMIMLLLEIMMTVVMLMMMTMVMLMINKDGQTSQEADLQSWPLLHLRTAARTQPARTQYLHKKDNDDNIIMASHFVFADQ